MDVSTHSRPKAAGHLCKSTAMILTGFNTQPPEGGWFDSIGEIYAATCFNTQPPEGGWKAREAAAFKQNLFQHTAARRRLEPLSKALLHQVSQPRFR